ncbi:ROK family protein [Candidatus Pantoea floridensis]|uniref:N-acetyl-D-glucosamine kinase n=1 Tax=Candidatus Pantoea floridensis TaxID=1938870 RepID=A0A286DNS0_9GAMM|nr:ROK family protein [Pantoea floridensis]PIF15173.1 N-acetylglucosamine kinase [Enterobacteriaceae bacterium JKS000233]SOD60184.1 N-acetylglucosamine kinase [Pantoea floridensis]
MSKPAVICLDLGGSFIKLGVMDAQNALTILDQQNIPATSWTAFTTLVSHMIAQHQAHFTADSPVAISTAGIVAPDTGEMFASNIPAFHQRRLANELSAILQRRVIVHNDADCFTLAEALTGAGQAHKVVFGAILGSGVGGGLVADGRIITGQNGLTGEWGHGPITLTEVELDGETLRLPRLSCPCGQKGCLDSYGGARGLENLHQTLHSSTASSIDIIKRWQQQDRQAQQTLQAWLQLVGQPLAYTINITGASRVVVGGGLASVVPLIEALDQAVQGYVLRSTRQRLVVPGAFAHHGGMMGAALLARQRHG